MGHHMTKCRACENIVLQCRCPGPKEVHWVERCKRCAEPNALANAATAPAVVANGVQVKLGEFCFYQDMPISTPLTYGASYERRLWVVTPVVDDAFYDFRKLRGEDALYESYVYLTVKHMPQQAYKPFNRPGWHCDGFRTADISYFWSDNTPTEFSRSSFDLLGGEHDSMERMDEQARSGDTYTLPDRTLVRVDAKCVHRAGSPKADGVRTFVKLTFSRDRFDLAGNTHNYELHYDWPMRPRATERNVPQEKT